MLVINANNQQDTTNYMLADNGYPDLNSILMRGCPKKTINKPYVFSFTNSDYGVEITPNDMQVEETVGTYKINRFSNRANKYMLYSGQSFQTKIYSIDQFDYMPDIGFYETYADIVTNSGQYPQKFQVGYNLAVKGLSAGQVVGEHIYAPLLIGGAGQRPFILDFLNPNGPTFNKVYTNSYATVTFKLLHTNGTTDTIASIDLSVKDRIYVKKSGTSVNRFTNYITTDNSQQTINESTIYFIAQEGNFSKLCLEGEYNGVGQTAQEGDYLVAEVRVKLVLCNHNINDTYKMGAGIYGGGANNNDMRDIYGFRPFQVSIRDA